MKQKVLIVEDDSGIREALSIVLFRAGYDVITLSSAGMPLSPKFRESDIILLDRYLSGADGLDICKWLKSGAHTRHIPVIMLSATPDIGKLAVSACADGYLEKPFSNKALVAMVAAQLAKAA